MVQQPPVQPATALPMFMPPAQMAAPPITTPTRAPSTMRMDSPAQIPQPGSVNFAGEVEQNVQPLNW